MSLVVDSKLKCPCSCKQMFPHSILKDSKEAPWVTHTHRSEATRGQFGNRKEISWNEGQERKLGVT